MKIEEAARMNLKYVDYHMTVVFEHLQPRPDLGVLGSRYSFQEHSVHLMVVELVWKKA